MTAIFSLDRFDFRDLEDLVADGTGSLPRCIAIQEQRAFLTLIGIEIMDMVHFFDGEELTVLSLVANLSTGFASARTRLVSVNFRAIRGGRAIGILRILPKLRFKFFYALGQLCDEFLLPQYECPDGEGRLFPVRFADRKTVGNILGRHPKALRLGLSLVSCPIFQSSIHEKVSPVPLKMHAQQKNIDPLNAYGACIHRCGK
jgi:hypothetical protein